MKTLFILTKRNIKMFFKDKGMLFTSLITPVILLVLYATFLAKVYRDSFVSNLPEDILSLSSMEGIINGTVGGELISSLLAVSCVTVAFCSNMLMVQDKVSGAKKDFMITPVSKSTLALSYYLGSLITTLIVVYFTTFIGFIYIAFTGWYISVVDIFKILGDVLLLTMFGTALSSIINIFLNSQGQISAVGTIVSAGYGFICGAYMPISQFGKGLQVVLSFLPGTYATSLIRNHFLNGVYSEMQTLNFPTQTIESIKDSIDCNIYFFENKVSPFAMFLVLLFSVVALLVVYVSLNIFRKKTN